MKKIPVNTTGYLKGAKTTKNPVNIIPSSLITTQGMAFPIKANGKTLYPNTGQYKFPTSHVVETPLKKEGDKKTKAFKFTPNTSIAKDNTINTQGQESAKASKFKVQQAKDYKAAVSEVGTPKMGQAEDKFRARYKTSTHRFRYDNEAKYREQVDKKLKEDEKAGKATLKENVKLDPNAMFMLPIGLKGQAAKDYQNFHKGIIGSALPIPGVPKLLRQGKNTSKVDFSKYLTQEEAVAARAKRLLSQKNKPGWNEQLTPELEERLSTAVERHNPASDYPGEKLGANTLGRTATEVSKNATLKGVPLNDANKARIAAHETGHYYANSPAEGAEWLSHFNLHGLPYKTKTYLRGKGRTTNYANEIRERAAQLKDYIAQKNGIPLDQDFTITKSHLNDAIKNYVKDTKLDNTMSPMLSSLKNKKGLLNTMNKYPLGVIPAVSATGVALQKKQKGTKNAKVEPKREPEFGAGLFGNLFGKPGNPVVNKKENIKRRQEFETATRRGLSSEGLGDLAMGLSGEAIAGAATKVGSKLYKAASPYVKQAYNVTKGYGGDLIEASKQAGKFKLPTYENLYRWQPDHYPETLLKAGEQLTSAQKALTGSWFTRRLNDIPFYSVTRPAPGNLKTFRTSTLNAQNLEKNIPDVAKGMSGQNVTTATSNFSRPGEVILSKSNVNKAKNIRFNENPVIKASNNPEYQAFEKGNFPKASKRQALEELVYPEFKQATQGLNKPILGIDRKYFPFKKGTKTIKYKEGSKGVSLAFSRGEKDPKGGLTQKGVDKYNRATGGNLKMAVTTPPSKLKPGSKAANRRKSFCSRMKGMKSKLTSAKTANDPNSRINKSLRKWNC